MLLNCIFNDCTFVMQLFGYFQSETEDQELSVGDDVNVFTLPARVRVGDAAGMSHSVLYQTTLLLYLISV